MITADDVLKFALKQKLGDFENRMHFNRRIKESNRRRECSSRLLADFELCEDFCTGRRWRNRAELPRGFARLMAENKKCTGCTKDSVGNQSNFECCNINGKSRRKRSR